MKIAWSEVEWIGTYLVISTRLTISATRLCMSIARFSVASSTSSWLGGTPLSPGTRHTLVIRERPRTERPVWAAAMTSGAVDIPTAKRETVREGRRQERKGRGKREKNNWYFHIVVVLFCTRTTNLNHHQRHG